MTGLYEQYAPRLLAYVRSMSTRNGHAPEDVLHEVFLGLMRKDVVPEHDDPLPYLFSCARNRLFNLKRGDDRRRRREEKRAAMTPPRVFGPQPGREETATRLEAALARLPDEQREAVVLRIWGEMSLADVARVQQVPLKTAASRYAYGIRKLRQIMEFTDGPVR